MLKITFCSCNANAPEIARAVCDQLIDADVLLQTLRVLAEDEALNTIKGSLLRLVSDQLDQVHLKISNACLSPAVATQPKGKQ
jgi:hypothetical protein